MATTVCYIVYIIAPRSERYPWVGYRLGIATTVACIKRKPNTAEQGIPRLTLALLAVITLSGCGRSLPSESDVRAIIEKAATTNRGPLQSTFWGMRVVSVRKVDGRESEAFGQRSYEIYVDVEGECVNTQNYFGATVGSCTGKKRGQKLRLKSCRYIFSEYERGWRTGDGIDGMGLMDCEATEWLSSVLPRKSASNA